MSDPATYTVSDGELVLHLQEAGDGWYAVSTPLDPHVHTQAKTIPEAFDMARDAMNALREARAKFMGQIEQAMSQSV
jgi:predicted RNase H-like HicB family nuclease